MVPSKRQTEKRPNCRNGKRSVVSMVGWYAGGWEEEGWTAAAQEIFCMILSWWITDILYLSKSIELYNKENNLNVKYEL